MTYALGVSVSGITGKSEEKRPGKKGYRRQGNSEIYGTKFCENARRCYDPFAFQFHRFDIARAGLIPALPRILKGFS